MKEVIALEGLNIRQETADLGDGEASHLLNLDPSREPGALVRRRGTAELTTEPTADTTVRALTKVDGRRYFCAGQVLYRGEGDTDINDGLSANEETALVAFRPLNDTAIWCFIADDQQMVKDDGTNHFLWGIDKVRTPGPFIVNQTGKLPTDTIQAGTYGCAVTQLRLIEEREVEP